MDVLALEYELTSLHPHQPLSLPTTLTHSPMTNRHILRRPQDMPLPIRTPRQPIPLPLLPHQPDIGLAHAPPLGLARVLRPIKHKHLPAHRLGRDEVGVLGHVPRAVDFAFVVDALDDLDARGGGEGVPPEFAPVVVVVATVELVRTRGGVVTLGYLDGRDLEVVLCLA